MMRLEVTPIPRSICLASLGAGIAGLFPDSSFEVFPSQQAQFGSRVVVSIPRELSPASLDQACDRITQAFPGDISAITPLL